MNYVKVSVLLAFVFLLSSCRNEAFPSINHHQPFVASVNILQPSITFFDVGGRTIANWTFGKAYTGAVIVDHDKIILYGHQLEEASMYELSSGKKVKAIPTGLGVTNGYYDQNEKMLFLTNSKSNTVTSYNQYGEKIDEVRLRNYPMSMTSYDGTLYVINYKDTILSVVDMSTLQIIDEWTIDKSSSGILLLPEEQTIWIGGHGEMDIPNQTIKVYDLHTGKTIDEIKVSIMPVDFSKSDDEVYVVNHGANELFALKETGEIIWQLEVGANPFAVTHFNNQVVVAGYDDHKVYFIRDGNIEKVIQANQGPFQLLVREVDG